MGEITEFNQDHPFMFKIERIKEYIMLFIKDGDYDDALKSLDEILKKYKKAKRDKTIPVNSWTYRHLEDYEVISELDQLSEQIRLIQSNKSKQQQKKPKDGKTTEFYALFHFYQRMTIGLTEENKNLFGEKYGFKNGEKLFLDFQRLSDDLNRRKQPNSRTTLKNRIKLLERVQNVLPEGLANGKINEDLKILRDRFDAMFS